MQKVKIVLSYDGNGFYGWQKQNEKRSVQQEVETALAKLFGKPVSVVGASRTDAGVHALGQVASFDCDDFDISRLPKALNSLLPEDVKVVSASKESPSFSARYSVKKKTYVYAVTNVPNPIFRGYCAQYTYNIDLSRIKAFLEMIKGKHCFKGYCSAHAQVKTFEREILQAKVTQKEGVTLFTLTANGFMQHMVRIIVGTALDIGRGKLSLESAREALEKGDRSKAGKTMPPQGLYLKKIYY